MEGDEDGDEDRDGDDDEVMSFHGFKSKKQTLYLTLTLTLVVSFHGFRSKRRTKAGKSKLYDWGWVRVWARVWIDCRSSSFMIGGGEECLIVEGEVGLRARVGVRARVRLGVRARVRVEKCGRVTYRSLRLTVVYRPELGSES